MALIYCPDCKHKVSDQASICPECGYPLAKNRFQVEKYNQDLIDAWCDFQSEIDRGK